MESEIYDVLCSVEGMISNIEELLVKILEKLEDK